MATRQRLHGHESGARNRPHDELRDAVSGFDRECLREIGVQQCHLDLAAVASIDGAGRVHDGDAVASGETAAGHDERCEAIRQRDRCSRAHGRARPRCNDVRFGRHQIGTSIARVSIKWLGRARHQHIDVLRHALRLVHGRMDVMNTYRERLWPSPWIVVIAALAIPASLLTFAAINVTVGAITGLVLFAGVVTLATVSAPTIEVAHGVLRAGAARVPLNFVGDVSVARKEEARHERGPALDARAHLVLRPDIDPIVRVELTDPADPTPYWVVSTRRPEQLADAIGAARSELSG